MNPFANGPQARAEANARFWKWQAFKLIYVLCIIFVMPAMLIGGCAVYLAIYEPQELAKRVRSQPQVAVDPLQNPSYFVRQEALQKLVQGPADRTRRDVAEKIKPLLRDSNPQIQELAIAALGNWGDATDVPALLELAADRFAVFIRPSICAALGKIEGDEALDALVDISAMGDSEWQRAFAELSKRGPAAEAALLRRGAEADAATQRPICIALGHLGSDDCRPFLQTAAASDNPQLAAAAKQALDELAKR